MSLTMTPEIIATLKRATISAASDGLNGVLQGAASDIQAFVVGIVHDTITAGLAGDAESLQELKEQRTLLLEVNRLRLVGGAEQFFHRVLDIALGVAINFVMPGMGTAVAGLVSSLTAGGAAPPPTS